MFLTYSLDVKSIQTRVAKMAKKKKIRKYTLTKTKFRPTGSLHFDCKLYLCMNEQLCFCCLFQQLK